MVHPNALIHKCKHNKKKKKKKPKNDKKGNNTLEIKIIKGDK